MSWIISGGLAIYFLDYMYLVGFPLGMICYYILMKFWYLKKHPQKEIDSNYSEDFLGTTVGRDWVITDETSGIKDETVIAKGI